MKVEGSLASFGPIAVTIILGNDEDGDTNIDVKINQVNDGKGGGFCEVLSVKENTDG